MYVYIYMFNDIKMCQHLLFSKISKTLTFISKKLNTIQMKTNNKSRGHMI